MDDNLDEIDVLAAERDRLNDEAYQEGWQAYETSQPELSCPYGIGHQQRKAWHVGYYDCRMWDKHGEAFRKYGV